MTVADLIVFFGTMVPVNLAASSESVRLTLSGFGRELTDFASAIGGWKTVCAAECKTVVVRSASLCKGTEVQWSGLALVCNALCNLEMINASVEEGCGANDRGGVSGRHLCADVGGERVAKTS